MPTLEQLNGRLTTLEEQVARVIAWEAAFTTNNTINALNIEWEREHESLQSSLDGLTNQVSVINALLEASGVAGLSMTSLRNLQRRMGNVEGTIEQAQDTWASVDSRLDSMQSTINQNVTMNSELLSQMTMIEVMLQGVLYPS